MAKSGLPFPTDMNGHQVDVLTCLGGRIEAYTDTTSNIEICDSEAPVPAVTSLSEGEARVITLTPTTDVHVRQCSTSSGEATATGNTTLKAGKLLKANTEYAILVHSNAKFLAMIRSSANGNMHIGYHGDPSEVAV